MSRALLVPREATPLTCSSPLSFVIPILLFARLSELLPLFSTGVARLFGPRKKAMASSNQTGGYRFPNTASTYQSHSQERSFSPSRRCVDTTFPSAPSYRGFDSPSSPTRFTFASEQNLSSFATSSAYQSNHKRTPLDHSPPPYTSHVRPPLSRLPSLQRSTSSTSFARWEDTHYLTTTTQNFSHQHRPSQHKTNPRNGLLPDHSTPAERGTSGVGDEGGGKRREINVPLLLLPKNHK